MSTRLNELYRDFSPWLSLQVSPKERKRIWEQTQDYSNTHARYNAYLNKVCLNTFRTWISDLCVESSLPEPSICLSDDTLEVVNGTAIQLGDLARIVLIPSEPIDSEELCVPQEWVDIPSWAGDYYLAVQVDVSAEEDECCIEVCGFATYRQLKNSGKYIKESRTYVLAVEELTEDLVVMQAMLGLNMKEEIPPLPTLSKAKATELLQRLGDKSVYFPRLQVDVPFEQWAALLSDDKLRQQLYQRRIWPWPIIDLNQWLNGLVDEVWQTVEAIFCASLEPIAVRGTEVSEPISPDALAPVIRLLESNQPETRYHAAGVLGDIGAGNPDAIKALTGLLHTTQDEKTRWQAALSLGKIDPTNPEAGVEKARLIDLGIQLGGHTVALIVAIMPKDGGRIGVFIKVQPHIETKLPPHLKLSVFSEIGEKQLEVAARSDDSGKGMDNSIALSFSPPPGNIFRVSVTLDEVSVTESFLT